MSRRTIAGLMLLTGCAGARPNANANAHANANANAHANAHANANANANANAGVDAGDRFAELVARGARQAPGLREHARFDGPPPRIVADRDLCLRVVLTADAPADAWISGPDGPRGATAHGRELVVPPTGPACARKGETLSLAFETPLTDAAAGVTARGIVYVSP